MPSRSPVLSIVLSLIAETLVSFMVSSCIPITRSLMSQMVGQDEQGNMTRTVRETHYNDVINGCDGVSNHQPHDCFLNRVFRHRSKKTTKLHVTGLCAGKSQEAGEFPAQMASNAENVSIWWRHHESRRVIAIYSMKIESKYSDLLSITYSWKYHLQYLAPLFKLH